MEKLFLPMMAQNLADRKEKKKRQNLEEKRRKEEESRRVQEELTRKEEADLRKQEKEYLNQQMKLLQQQLEGNLTAQKFQNETLIKEGEKKDNMTAVEKREEKVERVARTLIKMQQGEDIYSVFVRFGELCWIRKLTNMNGFLC